jgi:hypothetical protein
MKKTCQSIGFTLIYKHQLKKGLKMQNSIQIAYTPYRTEHDGSERLINGVEAVMNAMKNVLKSMQSGYVAWQEKREAARAEAEMWAYAQQDPRLMAEIQASVSRQDV